jgi:peptidyl-prolyl cis-trans isomerase SurA
MNKVRAPNLRAPLVGLLFLLGALAPIRDLPAQESGLVDRIAAVVGDSVITLTQVQERIFQLEYQGVEVPTEPDALLQLQRDLLGTMVEEQLIVQAALQDTTILVDEGELDQIVSEDRDTRAREFGGQAAFQQALSQQRWTLGSYREFLRGQARQQRLYNQFLAKQVQDVGSIVVEESEILEFFELQRARMGERPPSATFTQIILVPSPSDSSREAARAEANRIRGMAIEGEPFEDLARRFSQDTGSGEQGGDLGWFRRGAMVEAFEDVAFLLPEGAISEPVETSFGFHVIRVDRRRSGEVRARHILIQAQVSDRDEELTGILAGEVKGKLEAGEPFEALRATYGDTLAPDTLNVPFDRLGELPPGFAEPLTRAEAGQILGPFPYETQGRSRFAVLRVEEIREGGEFTFEDLRDQIRSRLQEQKLLRRILDDLRSRIFVEIRL